MTGLKTAVAAAMGEAGDDFAPVQAVQLPLIPSEDLAGLPVETAHRRLALADGNRGRGRPPGARNRSTEDVRKWLLSKYAHPLQVLAETYSRPTADLAVELGCSKADAYKLQQDAAKELAPYVAGKMPVDVNLAVELPTLILTSPGEALAAFQRAGEGGGGLLDLASIEIVENQAVGEGDPWRVGQRELDSGAKGEADQALGAEAQLISDQPGGAPGAGDPGADRALDDAPRPIPPQRRALSEGGEEKSLPEVPGHPEPGPRTGKTGEGSGTPGEGAGTEEGGA